MAKKGRKKNSVVAASPAFQGATLREENFGRKHANPQAILRLQHLQRLATWASGQVLIRPLAAHYGRLLAAHAQLEGIPLEGSRVSCQRTLAIRSEVYRHGLLRCETLLQPGYNCTMRIEKNASGTRHHKISCILKNNLVYTCHFCSHKNLRKGTPKGYMTSVLASRPISESNLADSMVTAVGKPDANYLNSFNEYVSGSPPLDVTGSEKEVSRNMLAKDSPKTPSNKVSGKKTKNTGIESSKAANIVHSCSITGSGKDNMSSKRRKGWSGLREIILSNEHEKEQQIDNLMIPFLM